MIVNFAICDDSSADNDMIEHNIIKYATEKKIDYNITKFINGRDFINSAKTFKFDVVLLDVEMPGMNGIEVAKQLRTFDEDTLIIFITLYQGYAFQASQAIPMGFLIKAIDYKKMSALLDRCLRIISSRQIREILINIHTKNTDMWVDEIKIVFIEKDRNRLNIYTNDGDCITIYDSMSNIFPFLDDKYFIEVYKGLVVNYLYVKRITGDTLFLEYNSNQKSFILSPAKLRAVKQKIQDCMGKRHDDY